MLRLVAIVLLVGCTVRLVRSLRRRVLSRGRRQPPLSASLLRPPGGLRHRPTPQLAGLAFGLEVWAAALSAGAPGVVALREVASSSPPELGGLMTVVADAIDAGLPARIAWARATEGHPDAGLRAAAASAVRSETDGTALVEDLRRLAGDRREAVAGQGLRQARRAGVWAVLPLGLCSLPAYILLGVVPAVLGLVHVG